MSNSFSQFIRKYSKSLGIVLIIVFVSILAQTYNLFGSWQDKVFDRFFITQSSPKDIVVIAIDDETITALGGWPIARANFSQVLANLSSARAIAVDIAFVDPSAFGTSDDAVFQKSLTTMSPKVYLASQFDDRGGKLITPLPLFFGTAHSAYVNMMLDQDGVVRSFHPSVSGASEVSMAQALLGQTAVTFPNNVKISYQGPAKTFLTIPFIDVYRGTVPASIFNGKTVFIGVTAPDLHDTFITPFGAMPGVEIHANAFYTLEHNLIFHPTGTFAVALAIIFFDLLTACAIIFVRRLPLTVLCLIVLFTFVQLVSLLLWNVYQLFPNIIISLSFLVTTAVILIQQYILESKEKKAIRTMFQYYLMPEVIDDLTKHPERLKLGGEKRDIVIFFSDIRGFTTIAEGMSAEAITSLMNRYLTVMTNIIMKKKGLVDKYIGDAIMAFWGAPVEQADSVVIACEAVLEMSNALKKLNVELVKENIPALKIGIGLSKGQAIVGNIGSTTRFNYTALGDEVNFASRLEGLNKIYGTECVMSQSVWEEIKTDSRFFIRPLDIVTVKGKTEPKQIFELITAEKTTEVLKSIEHFQAGRAYYIEGKWAEAIVSFKRASELGDKPSKVFLERCSEFMIHPPRSWTGVYALDTK